MSMSPGFRRRWLRVVLAASVVFASGYGLLAPSAYAGVIELQRQTWRAQDALNLVLALALPLVASRSAAGSLRARLVELGLLAWLAYCGLHLALGAVFNPVFPIYLVMAGLAGFGFLDGLLRSGLVGPDTGFPVRSTVWFLAVAGLGIGGLWLSEIVPGVAGLAVPPNLHLGGLPNPTWVLDLLWLIPWSLGAAWQLRRRHPAAELIAIPLLVLLLVLSAAMLLVTPFALVAGLADDPFAGPQLVPFTILFGVLGAAEAVLLALGLRAVASLRLVTRPGWWAEPASARVPAEALQARGR